MTTAYVGLGSNMGDRLDNIARAVDAIAHLPQTHVETISHAYETKPAFVEDQPDFANAVVEIDTSLTADALLELLLGIESDMGRVRDVNNGPRVIDLDLLLFGDEEWQSERLTLPHPGIAERDFVLTPLLEIAPRTKLPDGTLLQRSNARFGDVLRDLGEVPDAGLDHNQPVDADEWVAVHTSEAVNSISGFDAAMQLRAEALEQEGIPFAYDPYEPGTDMDPFGMPQPFSLLVPQEYAERASRLLEALANAPVVEPEGAGEPVAAEKPEGTAVIGSSSSSET